eukprot:12939217-Prorocentrum_lima.AAC.1
MLSVLTVTTGIPAGIASSTTGVRTFDGGVGSTTVGSPWTIITASGTPMPESATGTSDDTPMPAPVTPVSAPSKVL